MINYHKKKLIDEWQKNLNETFELTLDTADFIKEKYRNKIQKYIFRYMKQQKRRIDCEDKAYQKVLKLLIQDGKIKDTTSKESVLEDYLADQKADQEENNQTTSN